MNNESGITRSGTRATMKDVAIKAGVALKTVSRVVNGESGVTPETATRVLGAIEELSFLRNESARLLRTGKTDTIGFITDNWGDREHAMLGRGVEEVARERGFLIFAGSTDSDPRRAEQLALRLCARRVDGLIVVPTPGDHDYLIPEIEAGTATVFALRPPSRVTADVALVDEAGGARAAVAHLAAYGHKRIGYLGGDPSGYRTRQLLRGYRTAMAAAGFPVEEAWTSLSPQNLADSTVTAVLCGSREHTALAVRSAAASRRSRQIAVIGFGDFEFAGYFDPDVTVVSYDSAEIGREAAKLLFDRMEDHSSPPRRVHIRARLIQRGSAEISPARA